MSMFLLLIVIGPAIVLITSIIGYLLFEKWFVTPLITLGVFTILTFLLFNETFFIWVIIYSALSLVVNLILKILIK